MVKNRIVYEIDLDERNELVKAMFDIPGTELIVRQIRKKSIIAGVVFFVASLTSAGVVLSLLGESLLSPSFGLIVVVMLIWAFHFIYRNFTLTGVGRHLNEFYANISKSQGGPGVHGQVYMELRENALVVGDLYTSAQMRWPCFKRFVSCPTCTLCELTNNNLIAIPMRAFEYDEHAYDAFINELKSLNDGAGGWDGIVSRHLQDYSLSCPSCKYELHESASATCPECGKALTATDFQFEKVKRASEPLDVDAMSARVWEMLNAHL